MLVKKANVFPVECIVRGYLAGSRPEGVPARGHRLRHPAAGGPRRVEPSRAAHLHAEHEGRDRRPRREHQLRARWSRSSARTPATSCGTKSLAVYSAARDHAATRGIIIADTKFEFGVIDGKVTLVDEVLTPDSSRFWPADTYDAGQEPAQLRQAVRARLARGERLGQDAAATEAARRRDRGDLGEVHPGL